VVNDATASQGKAIAQENAEPTPYRFPLAVYTPIAAKNVAVSVRFKAVAGNIDRAAGIARRLSGPSEYYVVRASVVEQNVILYRITTC
jgi:hypothetical protein